MTFTLYDLATMDNLELSDKEKQTLKTMSYNIDKDYDKPTHTLKITTNKELDDFDKQTIKKFLEQTQVFDTTIDLIF